jgi:hypothetical protein
MDGEAREHEKKRLKFVGKRLALENDVRPLRGALPDDGRDEGWWHDRNEAVMRKRKLGYVWVSLGH